MSLPAYTSIGSYPLFYLVSRSGATFCHACAPAEGLTERDGHVHWEGRPLECDTCGADIESAYGNPETDLSGEEDLDRDMHNPNG